MSALEVEIIGSGRVRPENAPIRGLVIFGPS